MNENINFFWLFWGDIVVVKLEFDKLVFDFYIFVYFYLVEIIIKRWDGFFVWFFCLLNYNFRFCKIFGLFDRDNGKFILSCKCLIWRFFVMWNGVY